MARRLRRNQRVHSLQPGAVGHLIALIANGGGWGWAAAFGGSGGGARAPVASETKSGATQNSSEVWSWESAWASPSRSTTCADGGGRRARRCSGRTAPRADRRSAVRRGPARGPPAARREPAPRRGSGCRAAGCTASAAAASSGGSRTTATPELRRPAGSSASAIALASRVVEAPERDQRDLAGRAGGRSTTAGVTRPVELALGVELGLERRRSAPAFLQVGRQALLEVVGGAADDVGAEPDADQDPDGEREEDGGQRGRVVAAE